MTGTEGISCACGNKFLAINARTLLFAGLLRTSIVTLMDYILIRLVCRGKWWRLCSVKIRISLFKNSIFLRNHQQTFHENIFKKNSNNSSRFFKVFQVFIATFPLCFLTFPPKLHLLYLKMRPTTLCKANFLFYTKKSCLMFFSFSM